MKVLIIQSHNGWLRLCKRWVNNRLPACHLESVVYTNSFDHAIDMIKEEKFSLIITSAVFCDAASEHRDTATRTMRDDEKNPNILAQIAKNIHPKTKVYVLSNQKKERFETNFTDGWISKEKNPKYEITELVSSAVR